MRYIFTILLFNTCFSTNLIFANSYEGFDYVKSGAYIEALSKFEDKQDPRSELGVQYCYLRMNNVMFDEQKTRSLLFSVNIPDSIFRSIAIDLFNAYYCDSLIQQFGNKILEYETIFSDRELRRIYHKLALSYERTSDFQAAIFSYEKEVKIIVANKENFSIYEWIGCKHTCNSIYRLNKSLKNYHANDDLLKFCDDNNIEIDTTFISSSYENVVIGPTISDDKSIDNISYFDLSISKTYRDTIIFNIQQDYISLVDKLALSLEVARLDSVYITPNHIKWDYYLDLLRIAKIFRIMSLYDDEGKYLKKAYVLLSNNQTIWDKDVKEYINNKVNENNKSKVLTLLVDNAINQHNYTKALEYEELLAKIYKERHGIDENTFIHSFSDDKNCIKYYSISPIHYYDYSWAPEILELTEHIIRKATILYELHDYEGALSLCKTSDSILKSYNRFSEAQLEEFKFDTHTLCLQAKCYLQLQDSDHCFQKLTEAFTRNCDYYWDIALLQKSEESVFGWAVVFSNQDRQYTIKKMAPLKNLIYLSSYIMDSKLLNKLCYNQCLFEKQILLETSNMINKIAITDKNNHYYTIVQLKTELDKTTNIYTTDSIKQLIEEEERLLIKDILPSIQPSERQSLLCKVEDVVNKLSSNVAIEYMVVPLNEDSTMYCALLLRNNSKYPEMIPLFEEKEVLSLVNTSSENQTSFTYSYEGNGEQLSNLIWGKILPYIKKGETIYFAPSGLLHQVAIEALPYDENHTMADMFNLVRLSSTREIVLNKSNDTHTTATLYGGIKYDMSGEELLAESEQYSSTTLLASRGIENDTLNRGSVRYLSGTKKEVESINKMLNDNNLSVQLFTTTNANEESFKALSGKHQNILHIATHGFYWSDSTAQKKDYFSQHMLMMDDKMPSPPTIDPLNRCGLLFAGANTALSGHSADLPEGVQDGILTAKEISLLDLRDADLVVLSACETGKGEITGEGVFGLQRAFKQAGAQTIIMSLWPVNDAATQLLMTEFYRNWITNHQSKREAFRNAQNTVRSKYEEPVYWAGFIMLD